MAGDYTVDHALSDEDRYIHHVWDRSITPILTIEPGEVVRFECRDATDGQVDRGTSAADVASIDTDLVHPLTGPIYVDGAHEGDVLAVEFLEFEHHGWGYTFCLPGDRGSGLLPEEFPDPAIHIWELEANVGHFVDGITVPLAPFPGIAGVAPAEAGGHSTGPPRRVGGNMDIKHLTAGSTLYLPVANDGALFSVGDCHAAQGDGEVSITGIEAPMDVTTRIDLREDMGISHPQFETTGPFTPANRDEPMYATSGIASDLMEATKQAIRRMIDHLESHRGLSREEGYLLCSAAVDLKINEVVNTPHWTVSAYLPESLFP